MTRVAVLGTGAMGARMAVRLVEAGHDVVVHNRTRERATTALAAGARWSGSPAEAASGADVVLSMLTDVPASRAVWLGPAGAVEGLAPSAVAAECGTVTSAWIEELSAAVAARGARLVDAPVVGTRPQAEAGQLVSLLGGEEAEVARLRPVLAATSARVVHVGPRGRGIAMKLVVNGFYAVQVAALAELRAVAVGAGVHEERAAEVLQALPVTAPALSAALDAMLTDRHAPMFPVALVAKDLGYLRELAASAGVETPAAAATHALYVRAAAAGLGEQNVTGVARLFPAPPPG
jgi:3-hydroxyisobutyrate dehydrogenase